MRGEPRDAEAELCRALGDPTRLRIVVSLAQGPLCVSELCHSLGAPQSTISRHLKILRDRTLVKATRDAHRVLYSLGDRHLLKVIDGLSRYLACTEAAARFRASWGDDTVLPSERGVMNDVPARARHERFAEDCLVCGAPLDYATTPSTQACAYCGHEESALISCPGGHFVCDACHGAPAMDLARNVLENAATADASTILERVLALPGLPMHGPEHHAIVAGVIVAAAGKAGVALPADAVATALRRAGKVPGGWCGYYGACGAAVGVGVAVSVMTEATPLRGPQRSSALAATSFVLSRMIDDQPRCCKRASRVAIDAAVEFLGERLGIALPSAPAPRCAVSERNKQCPGDDCPFFAA